MIDHNWTELRRDVRCDIERHIEQQLTEYRAPMNLPTCVMLGMRDAMNHVDAASPAQRRAALVELAALASIAIELMDDNAPRHTKTDDYAGYLKTDG